MILPEPNVNVEFKLKQINKTLEKLVNEKEMGFDVWCNSAHTLTVAAVVDPYGPQLNIKAKRPIWMHFKSFLRISLCFGRGRSCAHILIIHLGSQAHLKNEFACPQTVRHRHRLSCNGYNWICVATALTRKKVKVFFLLWPLLAPLLLPCISFVICLSFDSFLCAFLFLFWCRSVLSGTSEW